MHDLPFGRDEGSGLEESQVLTFLHPARPAGRLAGLRAKLGRGAVLAISIALSFNLSVQPAAAQAISIIRDTEIERVLRGYEVPLRSRPASIRDRQLYLVDDPEINAFATQSPADDEQEDIFINARPLDPAQDAESGHRRLAHETGHIAGGDMTKFSA